jgi:hypothetical protein
MSYDQVNPTFYQTFQPHTPFHAGGPGWTKSPWVTWGNNPNLAGRRRLATDGLGAVLPGDPKVELARALQSWSQRPNRVRRDERIKAVESAFHAWQQYPYALVLPSAQNLKGAIEVWLGNPMARWRIDALKVAARQWFHDAIPAQYNLAIAGLGSADGLGGCGCAGASGLGSIVAISGLGADPSAPAPVPAAAMPPPMAPFPPMVEQPPWRKALGMAAAAACAYHGFKRNNSAGWAIAWSAFGSAIPFLAIPIALAQGFGKPQTKAAMATNRRGHRRHRRNARRRR